MIVTLLDLMGTKELKVANENIYYYFDVECFENYFMICIKDQLDKYKFSFELFENEKLNGNENKIKEFKEIHNKIKTKYTVGFNSLYYDIRLIENIKRFLDLGYDISTKFIRNLSNKIIDAQKANQQTEQTRIDINMKILELITRFPFHIDLKRLLSLRIGLKKACLNTHYKTSNNFDTKSERVDDDQIENLRLYCFKDLDLTKHLFKVSNAKDIINLRKESNISLTSPDSRFTKEYFGKLGLKFKAKFDSKLNYVKIKIDPLLLNELGKMNNDSIDNIVDILTNNPITKVLTTQEFKSKTNTHGFKKGGIHSTKKYILKNNDLDSNIYNLDFASFYPKIMIHYKLLSDNILKTYEDTVQKRLLAKKSKDIIKSDSLKIVINSTYGQLKYVDEHAMRIVCIYGQLIISLLILKVEELKCTEVLLSNTDGVVIKTKANIEEINKVVKYFNEYFRQDLESEKLDNVIINNANNYLFLNGGVVTKAKGFYTQDISFVNNLNGSIKTDIIVNKLINGIDPIQTIKNAIENKEHKKFIFTSSVKPPSEISIMKGLKMIKLGNIVRFFYSTQGDQLKQISSNNGKLRQYAKGYKVEIIDNLDIFNFENIDVDLYKTEAYKVIKEFNN